MDSQATSRSRRYRTGYRHILGVLLLLGLLWWYLAACHSRWGLAEGAVAGVLGTGFVVGVSYYVCQHRGAVARRARWWLAGNAMETAEEGRLVGAVRELGPGMSQDEMQRRLGEVSDRVGKQFEYADACRSAWEELRAGPDRLVTQMVTDLRRDRLFGELAFGVSGDKEIGLPVRDCMDEWPALVDLATRAAAERRDVLLEGCLRVAETCAAGVWFLDSDMRTDMAGLRACARTTGLDMYIGVTHRVGLLYFDLVQAIKMMISRMKTEPAATGSWRAPAAERRPDASVPVGAPTPNGLAVAATDDFLAPESE